MVLSRAASQAAFNHVMDNVLDRGDGSPLKSALLADNIRNISVLIAIRGGHIEHLTYREVDGTEDLPMFRGDKSLLASFIDLYAYRAEQGNPIGDDDWLTLTEEEFVEFRMMPTRVFRRPDGVQDGGAPVVGTAARFGMSPVDNFKRGIKRDPALFPTLKDESLNDGWHRGVTNQARAQDVHEVIDSSYVPPTDEAKALFDAKQTYMYAVFEKVVQTDRGRAIVRQYEATYDAQKVYAELVQHHLQSTKAQMDAAEIMGYITTARFGSGVWQTNAQGFVDNWQNQVRLYERIADEPFSDKTKRILLENAVAGVSELRQVKNNADLETVRTGKQLTYAQYCSSLLSACTAYDKSVQPSDLKSKRQVLHHDWLVDADVGYSGAGAPTDDFTYDIDATVTELQAYAADRQRFVPRGTPALNGFAPRTRMPRDRWIQLTDDARTTWDKLTDRDKAIILGQSGAVSDSGVLRDSATNLQPAIRRKVNFLGLQGDVEASGN